MYGAIPNENIEALCTAPPENKSKNCANALPFANPENNSILIPGTAICTPILATRKHPSVNKILFLNSRV